MGEMNLLLAVLDDALTHLIVGLYTFGLILNIFLSVHHDWLVIGTE
jgi:hypothetical protein